MTAEQKRIYDEYCYLAAQNTSGRDAAYLATLGARYKAAREKTIAAFGFDPLAQPLTAKDFGL
jgi:hypothetical protein